MKKKITILFLLLLCLTLSQPALAIDPITPDSPVSLTVSAKNADGTTLSGMIFDLYKVADIHDFGTYTPTAAFQNCSASLSNKDQTAWNSACEALSSYVEANRPAAADTAAADTSGQVTFSSEGGKLTQGLYLIVGRTLSVTGASYNVAPMLVSLPNRGSDEIWDYSVEVAPKAVDRRVSVSVTWKDPGHEATRPTFVTVQLLKGGDQTPYGDPVVLSAANGWSHVWEDLPDVYTWSVKETIGDRHYSYTVENVPGGLQCINTYLPDIPKTLPQTGLVIWPIPVLAFLGMCFFTAGWIKRRKSE